MEPGHLLWIGFKGTTIPPEVRALLDEGVVGGVILFARNLESPSQIAALNRELQARNKGPAPLPIGVDQEGGRVRRVGFVPWPSAATLSARSDAEIEEVGRRMGRELATLGFNVNFAPVLDVLTNEENRVIGDRSFGRTPDEVIRGARAWTQGFAESGVACCGKHFPGHGHTLHDSHLTLPRATLTREELKVCDLIPFKALAPTLPMFMTAHVLFESIDPDLPATLSPEIRKMASEIGFDGIMVTDDLEMGALASCNKRELGVSFLRAGAHMGLVCSQPDLFSLIREGMAQAAVESAPFATLLQQALTKVSRWRSGLIPVNPHFAVENYNQVRDKDIQYLNNLP